MLPKRFAIASTLIALQVWTTTLSAADVSLAGEWGVLLDRQNNGEQNGLHTPAYWNAGKEPAIVRLPGSIQEQNIGDLPSAQSPWTASIGLRPGWGAQRMLDLPKYQPYQKEGEFKTPFWLTPKRVYVGAAWFHRTLTIPPSFANQRIILTLERPHWETTLFLDGRRVGRQNSLGTAHIYDVTDALGPSPAGQHTLIIRVDNSLKIPVGPDASAVTDQTQSNWNGIVGEIKLSTTPKVWLDDVQVYSDPVNKRIRVAVAIGNRSGQAGRGTLIVNATGRGPQSREEGFPDRSFPVSWDAAGGRVDVVCDMGQNPRTWDEFSPFVYDLKVTLKPDDSPADLPLASLESRTVPFGLREISASGTQLTVNGKPLYLRGTLDCAIFPLTGYPPTGTSPDAKAYWTKIYSTMKAYGLNHLRFHSWCPPTVAFDVADEMGVYLQIEGGVWAAFGRGAGRGRGPAAPLTGTPGVGVGNEEDNTGGIGGDTLDSWIVKETDAMLRTYGNHPSFILMAAANEPGSRNDQANANFLSALVDSWKQKDPRHLYTAGSNWPNVPNAQFQVMSRPRLNGSGQLNRPPTTNTDYRNVVSQWQMPIISHESGQWCVYPDFQEIRKYTGSLRPGNLEIFQDFLRRAGMENQARDFLMASGKFQALLYKEEIECLLRTPNIGGFQLLDLHDFPGQGTAPVGVVDAFWDSKPYITPDEFRAFCGPTVPLALLPKRIYTDNEALTAELKVSHFGSSDIDTARLAWSLIDSAANPIDAGGVFDVRLPAGALTPAGRINVSLERTQSPRKMKLRLTLSGPPQHMPPLQDNVPVPWIVAPLGSNDWDIWIYPAQLATTTPQGITRASTLDQALAAASAGNKVLFLAPPNTVAGDARGSFAPIFWNRITFPDPARQHTLSILCDPKHPALANFPTDMHSNWQWFDLLQQNRCKPMILGSPAGSLVPPDLQPLIQFIDDWSEARKLALLIEAKVGTGSILVCTIDLTTDLSDRPVARQLLSSLQTYIASPQFNPKTALTPEQLRALFR